MFDDLDMSYFDFVEERHRIWLKRQAGAEQPWTDDPILASRKFTNVFRSLDHGSQFLIRMLWGDPGAKPEDIFFRCFLYRYSNLPDAWAEAAAELGRWPRMYDANRVRRIWKARRERGENVFSGAYVILPAPNQRGDKIDQAVDLVLEARRRVFSKFDHWRETSAEQIAELTRLYGVGDFMAMQILTDWNYGPYGDDNENEFVVPGPGCRKGLKAWGWKGDPVTGIEFARDYYSQDGLTEYVMIPQIQRLPSLMDVQNTFCEFFKYDRYRRSARPATTPYRPSNPGKQPEPFLPQHWYPNNRKES